MSDPKPCARHHEYMNLAETARVPKATKEISSREDVWVPVCADCAAMIQALAAKFGGNIKVRTLKFS
jgi:hypothetical protein